MIFHGDCLDLMWDVPSASVDMVLCDLPYGATQNRWDSVIPLGKLWPAYRRAVKPDGVIVLTAIQPFSSMLVMSNSINFMYEWIWCKNKSSGHLNANKRPLRAHESVLVFARESPLYNPQKTEGHDPSNFAKRTIHTTNYGAQKDTVYAGGNTDRYPTTLLYFPVLNNDSPERFHPTQKPVALMEYLIKTYTNAGDTVLDNCMGSGTTGVACMNTGRKFIGIEKEKEYFDIAEKRISECTVSA